MSERITKNNKRKGNKKHGYIARTSTASGRKIIKNQRAKGRHSV